MIFILMCQVNRVLNINRLTVILCLIIFVSVAKAQGKQDKFVPERFQADLEQYITRKACLSPKEASRFFPVYSEMMEKQRALYEKIKNLKRIKPATEAECRNNIRQRDKLEIEIKEIQKAYHEKFMRILSAKKVYDVIKAEDKFHRQAFKNAAEKMKKKNK